MEVKEIMVDCPKEGKKVPFWYCTGSFIQQRPACKHPEEAVINYRKGYAFVKCDPK